MAINHTSPAGFYRIGFFSRTHGVRGNLVLQLDVDDPNRYGKTKAVHLLMNGLLVSSPVNSIKVTSKTAIVTLNEISSVEAAEPLIGLDVFLPLSELPKLPGNQLYFHEAIGMMVSDLNEGPLGKITNIVDFPQQPVAVVDFNGKELLFPFLTRFITKVDRENKELTIDLPAGLVDIYRLS
ncbi:MAG: ribosome maturation factor RimM [Bacteroidota bacterium]